MSRRTARLVCGLGAALLVLAVGSAAGASAGSGAPGNESFQAWFVQLKTPPTAKGGTRGQLGAERAAFFKNAADQGVSVQQRLAFDRLWNGVSVDIPEAQAGALAAVPGVAAVYPVVPVALPPSSPDSTSDPDLRYATTLTGADVAQNELGLDGTGVKVAIMDSGLDYTLPEFGSCSRIGGSCRVAGGGRKDPENLITGVAPGATLYAYRVFGCNGSTDSDIVAAAMERAAEHSVDILNMSIGAALNNFPNYPTAVAANNLVDTGTVVVASIGNSGDTGLFSAGAPGVANKVIGVASVDNLKTFLPYFTAAPDGRHMGYNAATAALGAPTSGTVTLA